MFLKIFKQSSTVFIISIYLLACWSNICSRSPICRYSYNTMKLIRVILIRNEIRRWSAFFTMNNKTFANKLNWRFLFIVNQQFLSKESWKPMRKNLAQNVYFKFPWNIKLSTYANSIYVPLYTDSLKINTSHNIHLKVSFTIVCR